MLHHDEPYIIHPEGKHTHTLILIHGTSTSGPEFAKGFLDFEFNLQNPPRKTTLRNEFRKGGVLDGVRVVFPSGSLKKITALEGREGHAWFNVHQWGDRTVGEDEQVVGMRESLVYLKGLVEAEEKLVGVRKRIVLGGFSQGSAMGVIAVLSGELGGIGGFVGLSGWLPFRRQIDEVMGEEKEGLRAESEVVEKGERGWKKPWRLMWDFVLSCAAKVSWMFSWILRRRSRKVVTSEQEKQVTRRRGLAVQYVRTLLSLPSRILDIETTMPILLGHGDQDLKVRYEWALQMRHSLLGMGLNLKSKTYDGVKHWYCEPEMKDLILILQKVWKLT
ncbi:alpha/beta-hydrolase [Mollisia scopiformis]|uniref:Alpha/beta-hydrolase n=1 Tax=Mollisia scopiformis TaxID=149040 RepID=A0A194XFK3_MOLSC|nr:alpha/beta-hydrolase [Mollisia scopiformis]KUJ18975.1 alpha/beta-hydrolase [Mollisia scopiformis]